MADKDLKDRTKQFSIDVVKLVGSLNRNQTAQVLGKQILRSGTSVGANYRAVCRAKSEKDFINKLAIVIEEADETQFWLELLVSAELIERDKATTLWKEADELIRIMIASSKTTKSNIHNSEIRICETSKKYNSTFTIQNSQFPCILKN